MANFEKRKVQDRLETMLMEGLQSGQPTEMTRQDWAEIRQEALKQFEVLKSRKKARWPLRGPQSPDE